MKLKYRIEINTEPSDDGSYFWTLSSVSDKPGSDWCTCRCGWANSPEECFREANDFYNKYKKPKIQ